MFLIFLITTVFGKIYQWRHVEPMTGLFPNPKHAHSSWTVDRTLYIFGGCDEALVCTNMLHSWSEDMTEWKRLNSTGTVPSPRGGQSATVIGNRVFMFGGSEGSMLYNDLYVYDVADDSWESIEIEGYKPIGRTNHAMDVDSEGNLVVFGGFTTDGYDNSVFHFHTLNQTWTSPQLTGLPPTARELSSINIYKNLALVFGGFHQGGVSNELYVIDMEAWEWILPADAGYTPEPREGHSTVRIGEFVYVIGGCNFAIKECYRDTNVLDVMNMWWTKLDSTHNDLTSKEQFSASAIGSTIYTFGGRHLVEECNQDFIAMDTGVRADCGPHGEMRNGLCICTGSYTGSDCSIRVSCKDNCNNQGECRNTGECACYPGRTGPTCAIEVICPNNCSEHGRCTDNGTCRCDEGWTGHDCADEFTSPSSLLQISSTNTTEIVSNQVSGETDLSEIQPVVDDVVLGPQEIQTDLVENDIAIQGDELTNVDMDIIEFIAESASTQNDETQTENSDPMPLSTILPSQNLSSMLKTNSQDVENRSSQITLDRDRFDDLYTNKQHTTQTSHEKKCNCNHHGKCVNDICYCEVGYTGENCEHKEAGNNAVMVGIGMAAAAIGVFMYCVYASLQQKEHNWRREYKRLEIEDNQ